jgi:hypothetical protein
MEALAGVGMLIAVTLVMLAWVGSQRPSASGAADMSFLDDGSIRVGVDLPDGGVIAYVSASG